MASLRPGITEEEFRAIFGYSDDEDNLEDRHNDDVDSDLDFEGLEPVHESSDSEESDGEESESEDEEHEESFLILLVCWWTWETILKLTTCFFFIFGEETLSNIVAKTNRYAKQLANKAEQLARWKDITAVELKAYFGICVLMGINTLPKMADYCTKTPPRGDANYDRLYKIRQIINTVLKNSQRCYSPKKAIAVDEGMIAFKGRLSFRQYMPAKPMKYGIKVWMAADSTNGYVMNFEIYMGSSEKLVHGLGYNVVMNMVKPYLNRNFDNFFSSTRLLEHLQSQDTYACSTVRVNRKDLPPCTMTKLRQRRTCPSAKGQDTIH
ncbi:PiggyBac transposable element-derived protein 4 [Exaiptasia diaphana]|nr:PiggyBac transposable element-derived protein 4 [Exaiptasia diaphana]